MKNKEYWLKRCKQVLVEAERNTNEYLNQLIVTYTNAIESINRDIEKIFSTYKKNFWLDEAKVWLNMSFVLHSTLEPVKRVKNMMDRYTRLMK